jgi:Uncharacterised nucleotidyltransferase
VGEDELEGQHDRLAGAAQAAGGVWARLPEVIDRAPSLDALRAHRLQLLAAARWRARGVELPDDLRDDERRAAMVALAAPALLRRARDAYDGRLLLMKGPEVAARYPAPATRTYVDVDLLADDPAGAQRALVAAGFVELADHRDHSRAQHLDPLLAPGLPLAVEVHRRPNGPAGLPAPATGELLSLAVESATGIEGLLAPAPAAHALLLAAHAWAHHPLARLGDLVDVAAVLPAQDRRAAAALAQRWGWERMWTTTLAALDALLGDGLMPAALRPWTRHLRDVRELSVLENHVIRITAPALALPPAQLPRGVAAALRATTGPRPGEDWERKLGRSARAIRDAFKDKSQHDRRVGNNPWSR